MPRTQLRLRFNEVVHSQYPAAVPPMSSSGLESTIAFQPWAKLDIEQAAGLASTTTNLAT